MRRIIAYALCIAGMVAFWYFCKFLVIGISADFGSGVFVGVFLTAFLIWAAERVDKPH
jgi:hypothetical protein